jgi:hypothetical protein
MHQQSFREEHLYPTQNGEVCRFPALRLDVVLLAQYHFASLPPLMLLRKA